MCGFVGMVAGLSAYVPSALELRQAIDNLQHRGPDAKGLWVCESAGAVLGHRRLSVIDVSAAGSQPMTSADGRWTIAYNGELYNTAEMRAELGVVRWRGRSDTEVVVEAIARWGVERTLEKINAMFAFAAWDADKGEMWLARDRFGEKPLYVGHVGDHWAFASELKAISALPGFVAEIDSEALCAFLQYGYVPAPMSIYRAISKVPAGHFVRLRGADQHLRPVQYWSPIQGASARPTTVHDRFASLQDLDDALSEAVARRMIADVPIGAFLSGGIDSSLIVAYMQQQTSTAVNTYSIGFGEAEYDESEHARAVAAYLGTSHTEVRVTDVEAQAVIPRLPDIYCEPFADSSQIPTFLVSELARRDVTVALSGDGGDELFGGYPRYRRFAATDRVARLVPSSLRRRIDEYSSSARRRAGTSPTRVSRQLSASGARRHAERFSKATALLTAPSRFEAYDIMVSAVPAAGLLLADCQPIGRTGQVEPDLEHRPAVELAMLADTLRYLPDDILVKVDRASMAVSLEVRVPFLDPQVFAEAWHIRSTFGNGGAPKWPLRELLARYLPAQLFERPKMGFGVPISAWLRGPLHRWADDLLAPANLAQHGFFAESGVRALWESHRNGMVDQSTLLWRLLMFQSWYDRWHR